MIKNKTFAMLSWEDIEAEAKLTVKEAPLVEAVVAAVRKLPSNFCLSVDDKGFFVQKRITKGYARGVASVRRKSLKF